MISASLLRIVAPVVATVFVFGAGYWTGHGHGKDKGAALALKTAQLAAHQKFASPASRSEPNCWPSL